MKKIKKVFFLFFLFFLNLLKSQDYHLSQILDACTFLNPANAGLQHQYYIGMTYRQQWLNLGSPYKTFMVDINGEVYKSSASGSSLGLGLLLIQDIAGTTFKLNTTNALIAIMGKVLLTERQNLSAGIVGGILNRKTDKNLKWSDQYNGFEYDPNIPPSPLKNEAKLNVDIGTGIQWTYGRGPRTLSSNDPFGAQVGIVFYHLNKPDISFGEKIDDRYIRGLVHSSFTYGIANTPFQINPGFIYQFQGPSKILLFGSKFKYLLQESSKYTGFLFSRTFNFGTYYRLNDALIMLLQIEWDRVLFGISYDITLSKLSKNAGTQGTFEISLKYLPGKEYASSKLL